MALAFRTAIRGHENTRQDTGAFLAPAQPLKNLNFLQKPGALMKPEDLIPIETRLAYQEKLLHELNAVVFEQQKEIDRLQELCRFLGDRIQALGEPTGQAPYNEKPPHY